jgi:hypothetical protein
LAINGKGSTDGGGGFNSKPRKRSNGRGGLRLRGAPGFTAPWMLALKEGKTEGCRDSTGGRDLMWGRGGLEEGDSADEWGRVAASRRERGGGVGPRWLRGPEEEVRLGHTGWKEKGEDGWGFSVFFSNSLFFSFQTFSNSKFWNWTLFQLFKIFKTF